MNKFDETLDNRTYKILRARKIFSCCMACERGGRQNHYGGFEGEPIKMPSWKLVSKRKKQWMDKPIKIIQRSAFRTNYFIVKW